MPCLLIDICRHGIEYMRKGNIFTPLRVTNLLFISYISRNDIRFPHPHTHSLDHIHIITCCLSGAKPLPDLVLNYCQLSPQEQTSMKFQRKCKYFHSRKCICLSAKWWPFCSLPNFQASMLVAVTCLWIVPDLCIMAGLTAVLHQTPGVGVTKALFVNFSASKIFCLTKYLLYSFNHIHIW